ncbi:dynein axonemal light chain 1 [Aethina tumida]|uniref:dynein axonemal light chain 1 n=1 Tax=Aethina tumida TaxID=116153 RepID=UPI00096AEDFC|nr:dynein axonemal light chain 1 [Aethina tumida]
MMDEPTTLKEAIINWEEENQLPISEAEIVSFQFQSPPIEKLDNSLAALANCHTLSLSVNNIEKITGMYCLRNLRNLSLNKNYIKSFGGLEGVGDTLVHLQLSYNFIERLKGIGVLRRLRFLDLSHNLVREWSEFLKLRELPRLEELVFSGNQLQKYYEPLRWRDEVARKLPYLRKLDHEPIGYE